MFKLIFSDEALEFIHEQSAEFKRQGLDKPVVALFYYSTESWLMSFCGNVVELVEKDKVVNDMDFFQWNDTNIGNYHSEIEKVEIYIEEKVLEELENKPMVIIDAVTKETKDSKVGMLFMKKESNVYD